MSTSHDSETLAEGKQVFTACAFIHRKIDGVEKVFLAKRSATKKFLPNIYELPGGHIDFGEEMEAGLKREIMEEFGMNIAVGEPFYVFTYLNHVKKSHSIEVIYFAEFTDSVERITINPEDHSSYGWFSKDELYQAYSSDKDETDQEFMAVQKGFKIRAAQVV